MHRLVGHLDMRRARIGVRIDRDRLDAHLAGGLDHAAGDFAAVGDQDLLEHTVPVFLPERHPGLDPGSIPASPDFGRCASGC